MSQNRHLVRPDRPLDIWYADGGNKAESSNVSYVPGPEVRFVVIVIVVAVAADVAVVVIFDYGIVVVDDDVD